MWQKRAQLFISIRMRVLGDYVRVRARIIVKMGFEIGVCYIHQNSQSGYFVFFCIGSSPIVKGLVAP